MEINGVPFKTTDASAGTSQSLAETFDTFLALLTTQLKNQDPLNPTDSEKFTEQLVQFTGVEQSIATNKKLDQMIQLQSDSQLNNAVSYIGKTAEFVSDQLSLTGGTATISYGLEARSAETTIKIVDSSGRTVREINGETSIGRHELVWDGKDDNGVSLADGVYSFSVTAVDDKGKTIETVTATTGKVTGVEIVDGVATLVMGELGATSFDQLFAIRETPVPPPAQS
jgi:flagellar basal-body rod modification protein FlgD